MAGFLSWGNLLLDGDPAPEDPAGEWSTWGETILAEWVGTRPGSRPWAWWAFEASGPRRQVRPGPRAIGPELWFGVPRFLEAPPEAGRYETEAEFLRRNKLLLPVKLGLEPPDLLIQLGRSRLIALVHPRGRCLKQRPGPLQELLLQGCDL